jgi:hypothetical protein
LSFEDNRPLMLPQAMPKTDAPPTGADSSSAWNGRHFAVFPFFWYDLKRLHEQRSILKRFKIVSGR